MSFQYVYPQRPQRIKIMELMKLGKFQQSWVDALRSGSYQQGYNYLSQKEGSNQKYCPMGVLCDLFRAELTERFQTTDDDITVAEFNGETRELPKHIVDKLSLYNGIGTAWLDDTTLTEINDSKNYTFDDIADLIENRADDFFLVSA